MKPRVADQMLRDLAPLLAEAQRKAFAEPDTSHEQRHSWCRCGILHCESWSERRGLETLLCRAYAPETADCAEPGGEQSGDWLLAHDSVSLIMGILACRARVSHSRVGWPC